MVLFCLSSLRPDLLFFWNSALSIMGNGTVLSGCEVFLEAAWYSCLYPPQARNLTFAVHSLPLAKHARSSRPLLFPQGRLCCQFWLKTLIQEPDLWRVLNVFGRFPQLLYVNAQWEPCLSGIAPCSSFLFSIFHWIFILTNYFSNVYVQRFDWFKICKYWV